jgi:hypothetical protein
MNCNKAIRKFVSFISLEQAKHGTLHSEVKKIGAKPALPKFNTQRSCKILWSLHLSRTNVSTSYSLLSTEVSAS